MIIDLAPEQLALIRIAMEREIGEKKSHLYRCTHDEAYIAEVRNEGGDLIFLKTSLKNGIEDRRRILREIDQAFEGQ